MLDKMVEIIPVLDLKGGHVVRARKGDRANYTPIETPLSPTSAPLDVARGLLGLAPFRRLYIADIDAIEGRARAKKEIGALAAAFPQLELWIDDGLAGHSEGDPVPDISSVGRTIFGSESLTDPDLLKTAGEDAILSLDWKGEHFAGLPVVLEAAQFWPKTVIVMTLSRVGSSSGPDFDRLEKILDRAGPERSVFAAGGLRDGRDLDRLEAMGVHGVLVATALHDGRLGAEDFLRHMKGDQPVLS